MQKLLIMIDWYLPAYKAGGPIRSIVNLQKELEEIFDIYILTSDRDLGDTAPFQNVKHDVWTKINSCTSVCYLSQLNQNFNSLRRIIKELNPDVMYLNSMYSKVFALMPLWYKLIGNENLKTVLCPRGMLRESAVRNKGFKKRLFLKMMRLSNLGSKVKFHATDEQEKLDIQKWFGSNADITVISNVPTRLDFIETVKNPGELRILFAGRIHPVKNLHFALEMLQTVKHQITFRIAGNIEDKNYLQKCNQLILSLPENVKVEITGAVTHEQLLLEYRNCHLMFLPTTGENFGHSIFEALSSGRPVLISNQTPWHGLQSANAGADFPLKAKDKFAEYINNLCETDQSDFNQICHNASKYANNFIDQQDYRNKYSQMFLEN